VFTPGIENLANDPPLDVDRGSYSFSTGGGAGGLQAVCAGLFAGEPELDTDANIESDGFYDSIICGTGFAHDLDGDNTIVFGTSESVPPVLDATTYSLGNAGYEIPFVAGNGPLLIGPDGKPALSGLSQNIASDMNAPTHGPDGVGGGMHGAVDSSYTGVGAVHITPRAPSTASPPAPHTGSWSAASSSPLTCRKPTRL
jgi:hypothetical protein